MGSSLAQPVPRTPDGKVDLLQLTRHLAGIGINEVLVEAGINLDSALLRAGVVDELLFYLSPHLLGDAKKLSRC